MAMNGELLVSAKLRAAKKLRREKWPVFEAMNARVKDWGLRLHPTKGYKPL